MKITTIIYLIPQVILLFLFIKDFLEYKEGYWSDKGFGLPYWVFEKKRFTFKHPPMLLLSIDIIFTLIYGGIFWW